MLEDLVLMLATSAVEEAEDLDVVRNVRNIKDCFELSERKFVKLFRINKSMADEFITTIDPFMDVKERGLSAEEKILGSLRFFAAGSYQQDAGENYNISLSQPSMSRSINEVINAVHSSSFFADNVKFHQNLDELNSARKRFYDIYGFPGVIGCIDCTHVAIVSPKKEHPSYPGYIYINRKGYHSVNVQLICDSNLEILSVNSKYPGSTHDSFIWNNSLVLPAMQMLHQRYPGNYYLLGDSGYALRPWMMTPIINAVEGTPEEDYNDCQILTRNTIERVNGVLKMRFRCLLKHRVLHYQPETASKIINTCCALHNLCIRNNIEDVEPEDGDEAIYDGIFHDEPFVENVANPMLAAGKQLQQRIIRTYFTD